jgi:hypothetical protein
VPAEQAVPLVPRNAEGDIALPSPQIPLENLPLTILSMMRPGQARREAQRILRKLAEAETDLRPILSGLLMGFCLRSCLSFVAQVTDNDERLRAALARLDDAARSVLKELRPRYWHEDSILESVLRAVLLLIAHYARQPMRPQFIRPRHRPSVLPGEALAHLRRHGVSRDDARMLLSCLKVLRFPAIGSVSPRRR